MNTSLEASQYEAVFINYAVMQVTPFFIKINYNVSNTVFSRNRVTHTETSKYAQLCQFMFSVCCLSLIFNSAFAKVNCFDMGIVVNAQLQQI